MSERRDSCCDGRFLKVGPPGIGGWSSLPPVLLAEETHLICLSCSCCCRWCCGNWNPNRVSLGFRCNCRVAGSFKAAEQAAEGLASRIGLNSGLIAAPRDVVRGGGWWWSGLFWGGCLWVGGGMSFGGGAWQAREGSRVNGCCCGGGGFAVCTPPMTTGAQELGISRAEQSRVE